VSPELATAISGTLVWLSVAAFVDGVREKSKSRPIGRHVKKI